MLTDTLGTRGSRATPGPSPGSSWLGWGAVAWAGEGDADERAIRSVLATWAATLEAKDVDALYALQAGIDDEQRAALVRYFANAKELQVRISDVDVIIEGDAALATFTRTDRFTDGRSGRSVHLDIRINGVLGRDQAGWKIRDLRNPS